MSEAYGDEPYQEAEERELYEERWESRAEDWENEG